MAILQLFDKDGNKVGDNVEVTHYIAIGDIVQPQLKGVPLNTTQRIFKVVERSHVLNDIGGLQFLFIKAVET